MNTLKKLLHKILFILFIAFLIPATTNAQFSCPSSCLTNVLDVGSGWNHETNSPYLYTTQDQYWRITKAPAGYNLTSPMCAYSGIDVWNNWPQPLPGTTKNTSICINPYNNQNADGNKKYGVCSLYSGDNPYWFERSFCVCDTGGGPVDIGIILEYQGDISVQGVDLLGPGVFATISTSCQAVTPNSIDTVLSLYPGVYTLRFVVLNDYANYPPLGAPNGQTPSNLQVAGVVYNVTVANNNLVDNLHFGKNVGVCGIPAYPPQPFFSLEGKHCLKNALDTSHVWILPFNNNAGENTYTVTGPGGAVSIDTSIGMFVASTGSYTVTSTDVWGCMHDTVFKLYVSPHFSATPPSQCIAPGTQDTVVFHTDSSIVNYGFEINGALPVGFSDSNILFGLGVYRVICVFPDSGYCTASDTFKVGEIPTLAVSATPPCISPGGSSLIWAMASPVFSPARYDYKIFEPGNTLLFSDTAIYIQANTDPGATGIYTVYVTDTLYGCADTATIEVYTIPEPDLVLTTSKGCLFPYPNNNTATITATPTVAGTYMYQLNAGTPQISNVFAVSDTGTYYINIVTPNGCASVPEKISIGNCLHCNYSGGNVYQSMQWFTNDTSSIDMGLASPTSPIVIDGTLTVDSNLNIWNNPNVYFTPYAKIEMVSGGVPILLDIKNSTLQSCNGYWAGILADNTNENIDIDSSTLKEMTWQSTSLWYSGGVNVKNGAMLNATNSNFMNNHIGIVIQDMNFNYGAVIRNNNFIKNDPYGHGWTGISIWNVKDMEVGGLGSINQGNRFDTLIVGIEAFHNSSFASHIRLYNNGFTNINHPPYSGVPPVMNDSAILSAYNYGIGCAINASGKFGNFTVDVDNLTADPLVRIINCDAGIVSNNVHLNVSNSDIENTMLGIMSKSTSNVDYNLHDNVINKSHIGISQYGNIASTSIKDNRIYTRDTQMVGSYYASIIHQSPIGIDVNHGLFDYQPTGGFYNEISYNTVLVKSKVGIGIRNLNSDRHALIRENNINLPNIDTGAVTSSDIYVAYGIWNENAKKSKLQDNYIYGHPDVTGFKSRNRQGIYMNQSPNNYLSCNKAKYTRYGFYAFGDNTTSKENITYNKFNANAYPWFFLDAGSASPATFGNVGDGLTDNGNEFISVSNPMNWLNTGGLNPNLYKVYRNSTVQPGYAIYSDPSILVFAESGSSIIGNEYDVQVPANSYTDTCISVPLFKMTGEEENNEIDSTEIKKAMAIVQDSVEYINFPEVGKWLDKYRLYEKLDMDCVLRNTAPDILYFYNNQQASTIGAIKGADKAISILADSSTNENNRSDRYLDALTSNSSISSNDQWEMNEKHVNNLKLKIMSGIVDTTGYDTVYVDSVQYTMAPVTSAISREEKDFLKTLANTCPFIGGNAVYKARTLWALFVPGQIYDDRLLCIQGQNKNADYSNINIDSLYESQILEDYKNKNAGIGQPVRHKALDQGEVMIYPNPASTQITIEYQCKTDGEFILYNSTGQEVMRTYLKNDNKRVSLLTNGLGNGVYTYKCIFAGCESMNGKLTILK